MGSQTGVVIGAFIALHVSLILCLTGLGSDKWVIGELQNKTAAGGGRGSNPLQLPNKNETQLPKMISKGLWKICADGYCRSINETIQLEWNESVQALYTVGCGGIVLAVFFWYVLLVPRSCRKSIGFCIFIAIEIFFSTLIILASLAVYGHHQLVNDQWDDAFPDISSAYSLHYGWGFYVAIAAACTSFVGFLFTASLSQLMRANSAAYVSI